MKNRTNAISELTYRWPEFENYQPAPNRPNWNDDQNCYMITTVSQQTPEPIFSRKPINTNCYKIWDRTFKKIIKNMRKEMPSFIIWLNQGI